MRRCRGILASLWLCLALSPAAAWAAEGAARPQRMQMTEAVTAADFQQIEGGPLLIAAYAVVWVVFFGTLLLLFWRMRKVSAELRRLEGRMERDANEKRA
jgi:CcmD family protein